MYFRKILAVFYIRRSIIREWSWRNLWSHFTPYGICCCNRYRCASEGHFTIFLMFQGNFALSIRLTCSSPTATASNLHPLWLLCIVSRRLHRASSSVNYLYPREYRLCTTGIDRDPDLTPVEPQRATHKRSTFSFKPNRLLSSIQVRPEQIHKNLRVAYIIKILIIRWNRHSVILCFLIFSGHTRVRYCWSSKPHVVKSLLLFYFERC